MKSAQEGEHKTVRLPLGTLPPAGAAMPVFSIIFGNLMNSFGQNLNDPEQLQQQVCLFFWGWDWWGGGQEEGGAQGGRQVSAKD